MAETPVSGNPGFWRRIQGKLVFLLLVLFIPTLIIQFFIYSNNLEAGRAKELQANLEVARSIAKNFENFIKAHTRSQMVLGLALTGSREPGEEDRDRLLEGLQSESPCFRVVFWIDPNGLILASTLKANIGMNVSDRSYFREVKEGKDWAISELQVGRATNKVVITVSRGIRNGQGELLGVVATGIETDRLDSVIGIERSIGGGHALVDNKGMLVYRYPPINQTWEERQWLKTYPQFGQALKGYEVTASVYAPFEGKSRLAGFTPIASIGWAASAGRTEEAALASVRSSLITDAMLFLGVFSAAFAAALVVSRLISAPINRLRDHALSIGKGEMHKTASASGPAEIEDLAAAFNLMAEELQNRQTSVLEQREWLRVTLNSIGDAVLATDAQGRITLLNPAAVDLTGWKEEEVLGRQAPDVFRTINETSREPGEDIVQRVLLDGKKVAQTNHTALITRNSREISIEEGAAPIMDSEGQISGVVLVFRDVSEKRRSIEALRLSEQKNISLVSRFRLLSRTSGDLLASDNPQGIVEGLCREVMAHLDCHAFFNFIVEESVGKLHLNACAGIPEEEAKRIEWLDYGVAVCGCVAKYGERIVAEDIFNTPDLRTELVKSYGIQAYACHPLIIEGKLIGTLSFGTKTRKSFSAEDLALMKTVTDQVAIAMERMRLIESLRKSRDELDLRVKERTAELEESNRALQDFAYIASHDLNEPLRKVMSFGNMLKQKYMEVLGEEGNDFLGRMLDATQRMQSLLAGLLEYSRVAMRANPFEDVELDEVLGGVLSDLEVRVKKTEAQVRIGGLPVIQADNTQMRQLFQNLIGNALKFHKEDEKPLIEVRSMITEGKLQVCIEDNGIGFDEQYLEKIFAPFQRLHGRSSKFEGTGMGLAICKKIVERHGGTITAKSRPGEGSTFIVTLPLSQGRPRILPKS